ncbi:hypothetical protein TNCV_4489911 [Trichonephila clavipes]|nr:hypothetical protein TNCV_4489911 [Trichonephila clavipes]
MDYVILIPGQVMWTTLDVATPLLITTPKGGRSSSRMIQHASLPYKAILLWYWARTHDMPAMIRYPDHCATGAPSLCGRWGKCSLLCH